MSCAHPSGKHYFIFVSKRDGSRCIDCGAHWNGRATIILPLPANLSELEEYQRRDDGTTFEAEKARRP